MSIHNIFDEIRNNPMWKEYERQVAEQEEVKKRGYQVDDYCWKCKKFFSRLSYKICPNGYITYYCKDCE